MTYYLDQNILTDFEWQRVRDGYCPFCGLFLSEQDNGADSWSNDYDTVLACPQQCIVPVYRSEVPLETKDAC